MHDDAVHPITEFRIVRAALGASARVDMLATHAGQIEDALQLLGRLDRLWGPAGELAALATRPAGETVTLTWETIALLLTAPTAGLQVEVAHQRAVRHGPVSLPRPAVRHSVAADLVAAELLDSGCLAVSVLLGSARATVNAPALHPHCELESH